MAKDIGPCFVSRPGVADDGARGPRTTGLSRPPVRKVPDERLQCARRFNVAAVAQGRNASGEGSRGAVRGVGSAPTPDACSPCR